MTAATGGVKGGPRNTQQEGLLMKMMMEHKEKEQMIDVTVANLAVNRKNYDELFVMHNYINL